MTIIVTNIYELKGKVNMEQSKNKRANSMLVFVITLCALAIVVISIATFASKREESPVDTNAITESTVETSKKDTQTEKQSEKTTDAVKAENGNVESQKTSESKEQTPTKESVKPTVVEEKENFDMPVSGTIVKEFSIDTPVFSMTMNDYRAHTGIDIACEEGSGVSASASGIVKNIKNDPMMGTTVVIEHADSVYTSYMNLNETLPEDITVGAVVEKGQLIGAVGNSAIVEIASEPHLHFEMTVDSAYVDPLSLISSDNISVMSENVVE